MTKGTNLIYKIWGAADDNDNPMFRFGKIDYADYEESSKIIDWSAFLAGGKVKEDIGKHLIWRILDRGGKGDRDFAQFFMGWILMSRKMRGVLENVSINANYQWIQSIVLYPDENDSEGYNWFNSLTHINCIDAIKSIVDYNADGSVNDIRKLVLDSEVLKDVHGIFRLKEFPQFLLISEKAHTAFQQAGLTGYKVELIDMNS